MIHRILSAMAIMAIAVEIHASLFTTVLVALATVVAVFKSVKQYDKESRRI